MHAMLEGVGAYCPEHREAEILQLVLAMHIMQREGASPIITK